VEDARLDGRRRRAPPRPGCAPEHHLEARTTCLADLLAHWSPDGDPQKAEELRAHPVVRELNIYADEWQNLLSRAQPRDARRRGIRMSVPRRSFDVVVLGSGPGGQKAAVQAAKLGKRVLVIERDATVGGECVHRGTIPSKTLRETAAAAARARNSACSRLATRKARPVEVASLMQRKERVLLHHERYIGGSSSATRSTSGAATDASCRPGRSRSPRSTAPLRVAVGTWVVIATARGRAIPPTCRSTTRTCSTATRSSR
jgi:hypothetical protein